MIRVNGKAVDVTLRRSGGERWTVEHGGAAREVDVRRGGDGVYHVLLDGRSYQVRMEGEAALVDGEELRVEVIDPRDGASAAVPREVAGRQTLRAPMPGKVVRLLVAEGDAVERDQGVVVIEAMKMQNAMKAPKSGRVVELAAREGATVAAGDVLAVVE